jgi:alpha 1,3-mannosyltransferase
MMLFVQRNKRRSAQIFLIILLMWALPSVCIREKSTTANFDDTLHDLLELLPGDQYATQLLSPIDRSSGESMLRDMATRTRIFNQLFSVWQKVHPPYSGARSNVISLIRQRFLENADQMINKYDKIRCFFNRFTQHLFPWTMAYFADHSLLYASFGAAGRGIVMPVGNRQLPYALTSITTLRELGCMLPVEVFYLGNDDLHTVSQAALTNISGVVTRDLSQMIYDDTWTLKGSSVSE